MLALTFTTGIADAIGYLGLDRVFTANMTGNVVILGMALAGADDLPVVGPTIALLGFVAGAAAGGLVLRAATGLWPARVTTMLLIVSAAFAACAAAMGTLDFEPPDAASSFVIVVLAAAMGCQAACARYIAVKDVTTVVVTSTLTALAYDVGSTGAAHWPRRVAAVAAIGVGAVVGALCLRAHPSLGIGIAAVIAAAVAVAGHLLSRTPDPSGGRPA